MTYFIAPYLILLQDSNMDPNMDPMEIMIETAGFASN